jgi:hypothetical protein
MIDVKLYDWSNLDRDGIIHICSLLRKKIVNKKNKAKEITKLFRKHFKENEIPIKIRTKSSSVIPNNKIWVGAVFDSIDDKKGKKSIKLDLYYRPDNDLICLTHDGYNELCFEIADTILHELIHMRQYRRRNYKVLPGYTSFAQATRQKEEQEYLGHNDEIDAYAFNIACKLQDRCVISKTKSVKSINKGLQDLEKIKAPYNMYLSAFNFDHDHKVIKKLKKRIAYYLPYAEIGKPYKTKDWLKR